MTHPLPGTASQGNRLPVAGPCGLAAFMAVLFLAGWLAWFAPWDDLLDRSGTPLGADFAMFYVAGQMVLDGDGASLYDQAKHQRRLQRLFPGLSPKFCLPFRYPPTVAIAAVPLAGLPYPVAWLLFGGLSLAALTAALVLLRPELPYLERVTGGWWLLLAATWPVVLETLVGGQASLLGLLIAVAAMVLFSRHQDGWAGLVLGLACYKPNVLVLFAIGCLVRYPRAWRGWLPTVGLGMLLTSACAGTGVLQQYLHLGSDLALRPWELETPAWKTHGLVSLFPHAWAEMIRPGLLVLGIVLATTVGWRWRRTAAGPRERMFPAALLVINSLCNPYVPIYDLVLLLPAIVWVVEIELQSHVERGCEFPMSWQRMVLAGLYLGPHVSQALFRPLGVQCFSLAILILAMICYAAQEPRTTRKLRIASIGACP